MSRKLKARRASKFARVLQQLLDDTGFYTRAQWSQFLGISEPAVSQWVNDRTIPRADLLRMAVDVLTTRGGGAAADALRALNAIMDEPSADISPIGARFAPNLRSYLRVRSFAEMGQDLARRGPSQAEEDEIVTEPKQLPVDPADLPLGAEAISASHYPHGRDPIWWAPRRARSFSHEDWGRRAHDLDEAGENDVLFGTEHVFVDFAGLQPRTETMPPISHPHGLGPAWRAPRLVRSSGLHGRERQVSVDEFADCHRIALVGTVGSGKTAFLSHLYTQHARWRGSEGISLRNLSAGELGDWLATRAARGSIQPLIIDGFDEMPMGHREQAVTLVNRFATQALETPMLVASRPVIDLDRLSSFERFSIAPLSDVDLVAEITRSSLASRNPVEVDRFLCHLIERENLRSALRNPLFLKIAWSLFENNKVTPFSEGVIVKKYMHVLFERDHNQGFSRIREPWATPHILLTLLGEVALHLLRHEEVTFDESVIAQCIEQSSWKVPVDELVDLLLVLGLITEEGQSYCFTHRVFKEYFAARFVIESAKSAVDYFTSAPEHATMGGAMRIACSLASDATPLFETVMSSVQPHAINFPLLAQMLAQPITVQPKILADSCRILVTWLDDQTSDWKVVDEDVNSANASARWLVCAHVGRPKEGDVVGRTLRSIHQARSGPAYEPLKAHLNEASSSFLAVFSEAMDVEGRLRVDLGEREKLHGAARVAVEHLQLA